MKLPIALTLLAAALTANAAEPWRHETYTTKMGEVLKTATTYSDNTLDLPFPYQERFNFGSIRLVKTKSGTSVRVTAVTGLLMCYSFNPCKVRVKFDDEKPRTFLGYPAESQDSTVAFLDNEAAFVASAKKASKILVELNFYQAGRQVLEFTPGQLAGF